MAIQLTSEEKKLIEHAKKAVVRYNELRNSKGELATFYAFVLSDSGKIYDGACLESMGGGVCGERAAIGRMFTEETYSSKIKAIVIFCPVPKELEYAPTPCGRCRNVIWERGTESTSIICGQYIQRKGGWEFLPKMEKYAIKELYPNPFKDPWADFKG